MNLESFLDQSYIEQANLLLSHFWKDLPRIKIEDATSAVYTKENFGTAAIAPIFKSTDDEYTLELFHGPTGTFKDISFQLLPQFLSENSFAVAASAGNAGIAALKSFSNLSGRKFILFFPLNDVTAAQKEILLSYNNKNTFTIGVDGSLSKIHSELDSIFVDKTYLSTFNQRGIDLVSINTLPNSRVLPLAVPIIAAYCSLVKHSVIKYGEPINILDSNTHSTFNKASEIAIKLGMPVSVEAKIKIVPAFARSLPTINEIELDNSINRDAICRISGMRQFINMICNN